MFAEILCRINLFSSRARRGITPPSDAAPGATWISGDLLAELGGRAIPFEIAAMFLTFVLKSGGTQAVQARSGIARVRAFYILDHPSRHFPAPRAARIRGALDRVQVASLQPANSIRCSSRRGRGAGGHSRLGMPQRIIGRTFQAHPVIALVTNKKAAVRIVQQHRLTAVNGPCRRFRVAFGRRRSRGREPANQRAPKPIVSRRHISPGLARKEALPGDDGRPRSTISRRIRSICRERTPAGGSFRAWRSHG